MPVSQSNKAFKYQNISVRGLKYQSIGVEKHEREREHDASVFPDGASVLQRVTGLVLTRTPFQFHLAITFTYKNTKTQNITNTKIQHLVKSNRT